MRNSLMATGLVTFVSVVMILTAEFGYRGLQTASKSFAIPVIELNDEGHFPRPYVMAVSEPTTRNNINTLGYKGEIPSLPKPEGEVRIVVLGGSTVFGNYCEFEHKEGMSLPWHLEQALEKRGHRNIRVYNFGNISSVAIQDLVRLYQDVVHFEPDLVIHYGAGNDYANPDKRAGYPHRFLFYLANPLWISDIRDFPTGRLLIFGSLILRHALRGHLEKFFMDMADPEHFFHPDLEFTLNDIHSYTHSMAIMKKISREYGSEFVAFAQPMREMFHDPEGDTKKHMSEWYENATAIIRETDPDLKFVDLKEDFQGRPVGYWRDFIHLTDDGNIDMAGVLASHLIREFPNLLKESSQ